MNHPSTGLKSKINQIRQNSRQLVRELNIVKGDFLDTGYTFIQCHVLFELSLHPRNLVELAESLLTDKSNTSRTVKKLVELGLVKVQKVSADNRRKLFSLTAKGERVLRSATSVADAQVQQALDNLTEQEHELVMQGLRLYAGALRKSRLQSNYSIRPIQKRDNGQVARVIRDVMTEFQAVGDGYSIEDPEVEDMFANYRDHRSCYYVITLGDQVTGCGGIGPLRGGDRNTCELRKMFFLPSSRGIGLGRRLLALLMDQARLRGYKQCYLETLDRMWGANKLYRKFGFEPLSGPQGNTGHCACDRWYLLTL
jgi:putative acetyltransferase